MSLIYYQWKIIPVKFQKQQTFKPCHTHMTASSALFMTTMKFYKLSA